MTYAVGDVLIGKAITGGTREYQVTRVNRVTVEFKLVKIGEMPISGDVHRSKPDENGTLWITQGKYRMVKIQKVVA
jgi:hypothetical protein